MGLTHIPRKGRPEYEQYLGWWQKYSRFDTGKRSIFLLTVHERIGNVVEGICCDNLGFADFKGRITPHKVRFTKSYTRCLSSASTDFIYYIGKKVKGVNVYRGEFIIEGKIAEGEFLLERCPKSIIIHTSIEDMLNNQVFASANESRVENRSHRAIAVQ